MEEETTNIYSGKPEDFTWLGMGSGSGTNLVACAKVIKPAGIFCDVPKAKLLKRDIFAKDDSIEKIVMNSYKECGSWKMAKSHPHLVADYEIKSLEYNEKIAAKLKEFEKNLGKPIDLIVLGGYMRLVGEPLLEAYPDKIINVHPANLGILDGVHAGRPAERHYIGEDAVYDAIRQGEKKTCSCVIMVDDKIDHGEIITTGPEVEVWHEFVNGTDAEKEECLREYADAHQSLQKVRSDWPALTTALKLIAEGRVALGKERNTFYEWRNVYVDGKMMPYEGYKI